MCVCAKVYVCMVFCAYIYYICIYSVIIHCCYYIMFPTMIAITTFSTIIIILCIHMPLYWYASYGFPQFSQEMYVLEGDDLVESLKNTPGCAAMFFEHPGG